MSRVAFRQFAAVMILGLSGAVVSGCHTPCEDDTGSHDDGESWKCSDGCNTCTCRDGDIESTLIGCLGDDKSTKDDAGEP